MPSPPVTGASLTVPDTVAETQTIRRILVALTGVRDETGWLESIADLAARLDAELATLFVEDIELLRASRLPFAREIGSISALERSLDPDYLEKSFKAAAQRAERLLREVVQRQAWRRRPGQVLQVSFQVIQGRFLEAALAAAGEEDVVLLKGKGAFSRPAAGEEDVVLLKGKGAFSRPAAAGTLLLGLAPAPGVRRALELARHIADATSADLAVAIAADEQGYAQIKEDVKRQLGPTRVPIYRLPRLDAETLAAAAQRLNAALVVAPATEDLAQTTTLARLVARLRCPLLLSR
jgi:hypothetical protein